MCDTHPGAPAADSAQAAAPPTIGDIFREYGPAYRRKYAARMSQDQLKVMDMLERCRTGELGSVLYRCDACQKYHPMPRSCGNRHCPQCQGHKAKQWLEAQLEKLLPCVYFLLTFTVPQELRRFVRAHPRACLPAIFAAAAATLQELARNPKYVGSSKLGFTGVLHTWGRTLTYHPHAHFIVPGGALSADGEQWLPSRVNFLVPVAAASVIYRAKFQAIMRERGLHAQIPPVVWTKDWVVHSKAVGDGRVALRYLAPYVYRVAISNRRVVKCEPGPDGLGRVTFTYRPSGSQRYRAMTVTAEEFIRRFLQHVLPRGLQKVRHYGFAHPRSRIDLEWLQMLVTVTLNQVYELIVAAAGPASAELSRLRWRADLRRLPTRVRADTGRPQQQLNHNRLAKTTTVRGPQRDTEGVRRQRTRPRPPPPVRADDEKQGFQRRIPFTRAPASTRK